MYSISSFRILSLNNAEFVGFFINLRRLIIQSEAEQLGFDEGVMTNFESLLGKLNDQVKVSASSAITMEMESANQKRVNLYKRIVYKLKGVELAEDGSSMASLKLAVSTYLLKPYSLTNVTRLPMQELTTVLSGFILDAKSKFSEDDLDDLGIVTELSNLEIANDGFIAAYTRRSEERAETSGLTPVLRQQMYELYLSMCYQAQYLANSTLASNATKAAACQPFIGVLNEILSDVKKRYNQRMNALHQGTTESNGNADVAGGGNQTPEASDDNPADEVADDKGDSNDTPAGDDKPSGGSQPDGGPDPVVTDENVEF